MQELQSQSQHSKLRLTSSNSKNQLLLISEQGSPTKLSTQHMPDLQISNAQLWKRVTFEQPVTTDNQYEKLPPVTPKGRGKQAKRPELQTNIKGETVTQKQFKFNIAGSQLIEGKDPKVVRNAEDRLKARHKSFNDLAPVQTDSHQLSSIKGKGLPINLGHTIKIGNAQLAKVWKYEAESMTQLIDADTLTIDSKHKDDATKSKDLLKLQQTKLNLTRMRKQQQEPIDVLHANRMIAAPQAVSAKKPLEKVDLLEQTASSQAQPSSLSVVKTAAGQDHSVETDQENVSKQFLSTKRVPPNADLPIEETTVSNRQQNLNGGQIGVKPVKKVVMFEQDSPKSRMIHTNLRRVASEGRPFTTPDKNSAAPASTPLTMSLHNYPASNTYVSLKTAKIVEKQRQLDVHKQIYEKEKKQFFKLIKRQQDSEQRERIKVSFSGKIMEQLQNIKMQTKAFLEDDERAQKKASVNRPITTEAQLHSSEEGTDPESQNKTEANPKRKSQHTHGSRHIPGKLSNFNFFQVFIPDGLPCSQQADFKAITQTDFHSPSDQCKCDRNNQDLLNLLQQSPFLPIIEDHVLQALKSEENFYQKRDRIDMVVFEKLLEQICIGKYSISKQQVKFDKVGQKYTEKYKSGLDAKLVCHCAESKLIFDEWQRTNSLLSLTPQAEEFKEEVLQWFGADDLKLQENWIQELLMRSRNDILLDEEDYATFLTQAWKRRDKEQLAKCMQDPNREKTHEKYLKWVMERRVWQKAEPFTLQEDEASFKNNIRIVNDRAHRTQHFQQRADYLKGLIEEMGQTAEGFFHEKLAEMISTEPTQEATDMDTVLYLAFLEVVRQVSVKSKGLALLLLKIWHSHNEFMTNKVSSVFVELKNQMKKFQPLMNKMVTRFKQHVQEYNVQDEDFLRMKDRYKKALHLVDVATQELYIAQDKQHQTELQLRKQNDAISSFFPNWARYCYDEEIKSKLDRFDVQLKVGLPEDDLQHVFASELNHQANLFPDEADVINDIQRLKRQLKSQTIEGMMATNNESLVRKLNDNLLLLRQKNKDLEKEVKDLKQKVFELEYDLKKKSEELSVQKQEAIILMNKEIESAVKQADNFRIKDIMQNVREVQTSEEMLDQYFIDREKKKRLLVDMTMNRAVRALKKEEQDETLQRAMETNPLFISVHKPILPIVKRVIEGRSTQICRTHKKTLQMIGEVLQNRVDILDDLNTPDNFMNLDQYFYNFMQLKHGATELAEKYCEQWMVSILTHSLKDSRVEMFKRFIGLNGLGNWPFSVFKFYLQMLKSTNIKVTTLINAETDLTEVYMNYKNSFTLMRGFLESCNVFLKNSIYQALQKSAKVQCPNPVLLRILDIETYEIYRELIERAWKGKQTKSFVELLSLLYTGQVQSQAMPTITATPLRNALAKALSSKIQQASDTRTGSPPLSGLAKQLSALGTLSSQKSEGSILNSASKPIVGRDYVFYDELKAFIIDELDIQPEERLYSKLDQALDVFLMRAQDITSNRIHRLQALRAFTENVTLQISVESFLSIGVNAIVDNENTENQWFERVFGFYSQLFPVVYNTAGQNFDPNAGQLKFEKKKNFDGLEFVQFAIFCHDTGHQKYSDPKSAFELFSETVLYYSRQRLGCDNFIELIHKYDLVTSKFTLEQAMKHRYAAARSKSPNTCLSPSAVPEKYMSGVAEDAIFESKTAPFNLQLLPIITENAENEKEEEHGVKTASDQSPVLLVQPSSSKFMSNKDLEAWIPKPTSAFEIQENSGQTDQLRDELQQDSKDCTDLLNEESKKF